MQDIDVEVLLPVHNEGPSIGATIRAIYAEMQPIARTSFIVCEDGSSDNSKEVLNALAAELPMRLNLSNERKGYSRAVREGMLMCEAPYLLCLDSDGQCDPRDFSEFWSKRDSNDVLIGWRVRRADSFIRRAFSRFFHLFYQAAFHVPVHDPSCPFVLMRREVALRLSPDLGAMKEGFWWEFVARAYRRGYSLREIPITHHLRASGNTQVYRWKKMPGIFFRHLLAIWNIYSQTRHTKQTTH